MIATQFLHEGGILHLYRLQYGDSVCQGIFLHLRGLKGVLMASHGLIGLGDNRHDIVVVLHQCLQGSYRELGGSHEYDSEVFFYHLRAKLLLFL